MIWVSWHCVSKREPWLPLVSYTQHPYKSAWVHDAPSNVTRTKLMFLMQLVILSPYCWMFEPRRAICGEMPKSQSVIQFSWKRCAHINLQKTKEESFPLTLCFSSLCGSQPQCPLRLPSNTSSTNIQMTDTVTPIVGLQGVLQRTTARDYWTRVGVRSCHVHRGPNKLKSSVHTVTVILYVWITSPLMDSSLCTI